MLTWDVPVGRQQGWGARRHRSRHRSRLREAWGRRAPCSPAAPVRWGPQHPRAHSATFPLCPGGGGFPMNSLAPCPSGLFLHSALRCPQPSASPASVPCSLALLQALPFHPVFLGKRKRCHGEASAESHSGGEEPPPPPPPPTEWQSGSGGSHRGRLCRRGPAAGWTRSGSAC